MYADLLAQARSLATLDPKRPKQANLRRAVSMKDACTTFAGGQLKAAVAKGLPANFAVPREVKAIARAFADAQELRHLADYDRSERFVRSDVLALVEQVEAEIENFKA